MPLTICPTASVTMRALSPRPADEDPVDQPDHRGQHERDADGGPDALVGPLPHPDRDHRREGERPGDAEVDARRS